MPKTTQEKIDSVQQKINELQQKRNLLQNQAKKEARKRRTHALVLFSATFFAQLGEKAEEFIINADDDSIKASARKCAKMVLTYFAENSYSNSDTKEEDFGR